MPTQDNTPQPDWLRTETLTIEIPHGLKALLGRQAVDGHVSLDAYVSMLLVKGSYKG